MTSKEEIVENSVVSDLNQKNNTETDDLNSISLEEEDELNMFRKNAIDVVHIRIVYDEKDVEGAVTKRNSFKPEMAHQVFGEDETIFGYRVVKIVLYYMHNSARCYVDVTCMELVKDSSEAPDDVMECLTDWLPEGFSKDKNEFVEQLAREKHDVMYGTVLEEFQNDNTKHKPKDGQKLSYKINLCDIQEQGFKELHERFQSLIVWFIDGASYIDLKDNRWMFFYVYEEILEEKTEKVIRSPIGFCTVYKFLSYPDLVRARISQFFILPTHQRRGIGTKFYTTVFKHLKSMSDVSDITVEEPTPTFQKIRDYCDCFFVYNNFQNQNLTVKSPKARARLMRPFKICKRQSQRIFDILEYLNARRNGTHTDSTRFIDSVKARFLAQVEKELRGSKKRCNAAGNQLANSTDMKLNAEAACKKYIDSLEWPLNNLIKKLFLH